jgi:hypothetical protein
VTGSRQGNKNKNKTVPTEADPHALIAAIPDPQKRDDCRELLTLMQEATGEPPVLWGSTIVGFGTFHYRYASGREGDTATVGFAPRKDAITLYGVLDHEPEAEQLERLGKHKLGKGCVYVKRLSDVDAGVLRELITTAYRSKQQG